MRRLWGSGGGAAAAGGAGLPSSIERVRGRFFFAAFFPVAAATAALASFFADLTREFARRRVGLIGFCGFASLRSIIASRRVSLAAARPAARCSIASLFHCWCLSEARAGGAGCPRARRGAGPRVRLLIRAELGPGGQGHEDAAAAGAGQSMVADAKIPAPVTDGRFGPRVRLSPCNSFGRWLPAGWTRGHQSISPEFRGGWGTMGLCRSHGEWVGMPKSVPLRVCAQRRLARRARAAAGARRASLGDRVGGLRRLGRRGGLVELVLLIASGL